MRARGGEVPTYLDEIFARSDELHHLAPDDASDDALHTLPCEVLDCEVLDLAHDRVDLPAGQRCVRGGRRHRPAELVGECDGSLPGDRENAIARQRDAVLSGSLADFAGVDDHEKRRTEDSGTIGGCVTTRGHAEDPGYGVT